jgi:alpha-tubulin suppressor-like RCC1 family protein
MSTAVFAEVTAGMHHTCALTTDGRLLCWGLNHVGQLGTGTLVGSAFPTPVETALRYRSVDAGVNHTCAVTTANAAYCWGGNEFGELGNGGTAEAETSGSPLPDPVRLGYTYETVSAGEAFTCAAMPGLPARCWGRGLEGQLGNAQPIIHPTPLRTLGDVPLTMVSAGYTHACAADAGDRIYCWGDGRRGQLGRTPANMSLAPARVNIPRE